MLLAREREQAALQHLLDEARDGRSGVLALVGEPGIGKSALLDRGEELAAGMRVVRARGVPSEAQIPFAGLYELLRPALGSLGRIPEPQASALESALALRPARAADRFAVGAATLSLLAAFAEESPLAVLVDDVHWLDGSSADALLFAARRLLAEPIAVLLTARAAESSLLDGAGLPTLVIEGLGQAAAEQLVRHVAPDAAPGVAARLHRETAGNPLALLELARERPPDLPVDVPVPVVTSVADTYLQRAAALPDRTNVALVLAAATDRADLGLFARAVGSLGVALADLAPAEEASLVEVSSARIEFRHPLARSAIYGAATPERRRNVHRALADALPDADADRRAWHLALAAAGPDETASSALEQAGNRAHLRSAYGVASQAFERAALLSTVDERRGALLSQSAGSAWLAGLGNRALSLLDEASPFADEARRIEIDHLRGHIALRRGPVDPGRALLLEASARADPATAVVMLADAAEGSLYAADTAGMLECGARAAALAESDGSDWTTFFGDMSHGMALVLAGEGDRGAASIRDAVQVVERNDQLRADARLLAWSAMGPIWLREADAGHDLVDSVVATARARAAVGVLPHLLLYVGIQHVATDRWVEAQAVFDEAVQLARETGQRVMLALALSRLAWLEARVGREAACRAHAAEALGIAREQGVVLCELWALAALGDLELGLAKPDVALVHAQARQAVVDEHMIADVDLFPAPELVELYLRLGRPEDATAVASAYEDAAAAKGQPWARARAARCRALLAADDDLDEEFQRALALHSRTPDAFESAVTDLAYGSRLRRAGRRLDARERLRGAIEVFDRLGATPWAELGRAELTATGETARRRTPSTLDELTPQELQISFLLAEGRTTREAAAALFLSPKTIEYHLRNVYRKLAIHSRDELRDALRRRRR
jgi:DNA-binding CsgD family transcriptional regulator